MSERKMHDMPVRGCRSERAIASDRLGTVTPLKSEVPEFRRAP